MDNEDEDNYDAFMMSEDEAMGSASDLEFESDGDEGVAPDRKEYGEKQGPIGTTSVSFESVRDTVDAYMLEYHFEDAREELLRNYEGVQEQNTTGTAILLLQIWSSHVQYSPIGSLDGTGMIEGDVNMSLQSLLSCRELVASDKQVLFDTIGSLILGSSALSHYRLLFALMDAPNIDRAAMLRRLAFYKTVIGHIHWLRALGSDTPAWVTELCQLLSYKFQYVESLEAVLKGEGIPTQSIIDLQQLIDATQSHLHVKCLYLQLQMFLYNFLFQGASQHDKYRMQFEQSIESLRECVSGSLALQQDPQLTLVLHMSSGVHYLPRNEYDRDDEDFEQYQDAIPGELTSFMDRIRGCRNEFLAALKKLDEIGYTSSSKEHSHIQLFRQLILCVFIMASMVMLRHSQSRLQQKSQQQDLNISPFNYEPVRVLKDHPFMQGLEHMHSYFVSLDLTNLYNELHNLGPLSLILRYMSARIMRLGQTFKLWTQVAPNYSCISLEDMRELLSYSPDVPVSRDDVLTILMRSILKGKAVVYFKIDLVADLVHFGDELKLPVAVYPREHHFHNHGDSSNTPTPSNLEYANNVDVFSVETKHVAATDSVAFFSQLRQNRDGSAETGTLNHNTAETPKHQSNLHEHYIQLVGMATASIDRLK